jgi:hypothetical protein
MVNIRGADYARRVSLEEQGDSQSIHIHTGGGNDGTRGKCSHLMVIIEQKDYGSPLKYRYLDNHSDSWDGFTSTFAGPQCRVNISLVLSEDSTVIMPAQNATLRIPTLSMSPGGSITNATSTSILRSSVLEHAAKSRAFSSTRAAHFCGASRAWRSLKTPFLEGVSTREAMAGTH